GGPASSQPAAKGTGWTNLQSYVTANQGNVGRMADKVTDTVANEAKEADNAFESYKSNATKAVDSGTAKVNKTLTNDLQNDPTKVDAQEFTRAYNASYGGPTSAAAVE